jgi:type VI secretion system secreted protein VgrG
VSDTTSHTPQSLQETAANWTQDGRLIAIETPLGKDKLLLTSLAGEETISSLFAYELEMLSGDQAIQPESLIGRSVKIIITSEDGKTRPIHGMVAQFRAGPLVGRELRQYNAQVVPWLWYLGQSSDCRIFQHLNVPDIIEQVFKTFGFTDYQLSVARGDYPKLEFCVQYRETALNFVSRLMEEVGLFYFFRHEKERHLLVIADGNVSFNALPDPQLIYAPGNSQSGHVTRWEHIYTFRPGRWSQKDFNFETPSNDLTTTEKTVLKLRNAEAFERFDYPGLYTNKSLGSKVTRKLMEAEEAAYHAVLGASNYPCLDTGGKFTLARHPCEADSTAYVVRRVRHEATCTSYLNQGEPSRYDNTFQAIPNDVPFRPLRVTERPFVHGPQTAIVVGPPGEKIFTDKYGRVRVQFHWDRYGKYDDKSSCWIRVSHAWAGGGWGGVNLPHVGHEVIVSFLEGDPDRPLVTGRVYNGENAKAISLPANKTQSAMQDHSGNHLLMEGKGGAQEVRLHAVKDMHHTVVNDRTKTVGNDETTKVGGHRKENVDKTESVKIKLARTHDVGLVDTLTVGAARFHTVKAAETVHVGAARMVSVGLYQRTQIGAYQTTKIGASETHSVKLKRNTSIGSDETTKIGGKKTLTVTKDRSAQINENDTLNVNKNISNSAGEGITISAKKDIIHKNDKASITIHENGNITIKAEKITIEGNGDVFVKGKKIIQKGDPDIHLN